MGRYTRAEAANFKINVPDRKGLSEGFDYFLAFIRSQGKEFNHHGWYCEHNEWLEDYGDIMAMPIVKGNIKILEEEDIIKSDKKVLYVNENEYADAGGVSHCFFAKDKRSLEEFCTDMGFDRKNIEEGRAVKQTL